MKKTICTVSLLLLLTLSILGCSNTPMLEGGDSSIVVPLQTTQLPASTSTVPTIVINPTTSTITTSVTTTATVTTTTTSVVVRGIKLFNAEVIGNNIKAGNKGTFTVTLENQTDIDIPLSVYFVEPNSLREGYTYIGNVAANWVTIEPRILVVPANSIATAEVTLAIPKEAVLPAGNLEFWLVYRYTSGGFINYDINQRWLLSTKE